MTTSSTDAARYALLAPSAYTLALLLLVLPLLDVALGMDAFTPGVVRWRYGAVGLLAGATLLPVAGVFLAVATAHLAAQPRVQRVLGVLAAVLVVALTGVLALFVLDVVQLRGSIRPDVLGMYDRVSIKAVATQCVTIAALMLVTAASFRSVRALRPAADAGRRAAAARIVAPASPAR